MAVNSLPLGGEINQLRAESVVCEGLRYSDCEYLRRVSGIKEGALLQQSQLHEAELRLRILDIFEEVSVSLRKGAAPHHAVVVISVKELAPYLFASRFGWVNPGQPRYLIGDMRGSHYNFTGRGDILSLRVRSDFRENRPEIASKYYLIRAEYTYPQLFGSAYSLRIGIGSRMEVGRELAFDRQKKEFYETGEEYIGPTSSGWLDGRVGYTIQSGLQAEIGMRFFTSGSYIHRLQLGLRWDTQDDPVFPRRGHLLQLGGELWTYSEQDGIGEQPSEFLEARHGALHIAVYKHIELWQRCVVSLRAARGRDRYDQELRVIEDDTIGIRFSWLANALVNSGALKTTLLFIEPGYYLNESRDRGFGLQLGGTFANRHLNIGGFVIVAEPRP